MFKRRLQALFVGIILSISFANLIADVIVPNIVELELDAAKALLKQYNLHIGEISEKITSSSEGTILKQNPRENSQVAEDTEIRIILAVAKKTYKKTQVPNVQGLSLEAAKKVIQAANLQVGSIKKIRKSVAEETVLYQTPLVNTPRFENTQVDLIVAEPTPLLIAGVKLDVDKQKLAIGDSINIKAKALNISTKQPVRYSFTINRKVFYSKNPEFSYQFKETGKYNVLASVRYGREPWIASETQAIQVVKHIALAKKESANNVAKITKISEKKESKVVKQEDAVIHKKTKQKIIIASASKSEKDVHKTTKSQQKPVTQSMPVESQKSVKKSIRKNNNVEKSSNHQQKQKKLAKVDDKKRPNHKVRKMVATPIIPTVLASIPAATLADIDAINQVIKQAGDAVNNHTNIAVVDVRAEEAENTRYHALLAKNNQQQTEEEEMSCQLATVYYSDSVNETSFDQNNNLLPLVNDNIKTALLSSETGKETTNENPAEQSLEQFKQERLSALEKARQARLEHSKPATFTETKEAKLDSPQVDKNTVMLEEAEQQHIQKIRLSASKQDTEDTQSKTHHTVEPNAESTTETGVWPQWLTDLFK